MQNNSLQNKCAKYWPEPNESVEYGGCRLTTLDERKYSYYTLREIKVSEKKVSKNYSAIS